MLVLSGPKFDLVAAMSYTAPLSFALDFKVLLLSWLVQQPKEKASSCSEIRGRGLGLG